jgi:predicted  nucleic acid-binding Zn-ribbon protein
MLLSEKKKEIKQEIGVEADTGILLRDILVELRLLNAIMGNSIKEANKQKIRSKEQIEKIKENLPPEAKAIYDNHMSGLS